MQGQSIIINVPPGSGKSEMLSISAPAWGSVRCKKMRNLHVSFSDALAKRNSRRVKDVIASRAYQEMWPTSFATNQAEEWQLVDDKGIVKTEVFARSMGGQITGARGGFPGSGYSGAVFLDDPNKPEDMHSKARRDRDIRILADTLFTRRGERSDNNPTPFIIIQQRLHVNDVTGFIINGGLGKRFKYTHIVVPALIDQAYIDSLPDWIRDDCIRDVCSSEQVDGYWSYHPSMNGIHDLLSSREANPYYFSSQQMQKPYTLGGSIIKEDWWRDWGNEQIEVDLRDADGKRIGTEVRSLADMPQPPVFDYRFITADTAEKVKDINDFSVFCEWGMAQGNLYLLNMVRDKWEAPELLKAFKEFHDTCIDRVKRNHLKWGGLKAILIEDKSAGVGLIQQLRGKLSVAITPVQRATDKLTRAMAAAPAIKAGNVFIPYNFPMKAVFISEMSSFSADDSHEHDDICDNVFDAVEYALNKKTGSIGMGMMMSAARK